MVQQFQIWKFGTVYVFQFNWRNLKVQWEGQNFPFVWIVYLLGWSGPLFCRRYLRNSCLNFGRNHTLFVYWVWNCWHQCSYNRPSCQWKETVPSYCVYLREVGLLFGHGGTDVWKLTVLCVRELSLYSVSFKYMERNTTRCIKFIKCEVF